MASFLKNKMTTVLVVVATVILAAVAIFTATRLYKLRSESVSPASPESRPEASEGDIKRCSELAFTIQAETTPTNTPTATPTDIPSTGTPTPTDSPDATATPTSTPTPTATPTPTTAIATSTPTPTDSPIGGGSNPTATPTLTSIASDGSATGDTLPDAGIGLPTIFGLAIGILMISLAFLLAI